jgi:hypothetical protein
MIFIDFEYLEDEKTRSKYVNIINNLCMDVILLTDNMNNIGKAYSYGVKVFILDAVPKSIDSIESVLKRININTFVHADTKEICTLRWDTLDAFNRKKIKGTEYKSPYDGLFYNVITTLEVPNWVKQYQ